MPACRPCQLHSRPPQEQPALPQNTPRHKHRTAKPARSALPAAGTEGARAAAVASAHCQSLDLGSRSSHVCLLGALQKHADGTLASGSTLKGAAWGSRHARHAACRCILAPGSRCCGCDQHKEQVAFGNAWGACCSTLQVSRQNNQSTGQVKPDGQTQ